jgi:hypothetical protein
MKMMKEDFKRFVKEIIKEVVSEMNESLPGEEEADQPVDMTGVASPTGKTDKRWRGKMRSLDKLKNEPDFKSKLNTLQQRKGEAPLTHKTFGKTGEDNEA